MLCLLPCRYFLDNVAGWILELDRGQGIPFEGNYSQWLEAKVGPGRHHEDYKQHYVTSGVTRSHQ